MSEIELKPCPFCGVTGEYHLEPIVEEQDYGYGVVRCQCCGVSTGIVHPAENYTATQLWNRRPIEDAQAARIAELETERDRYKKARKFDVVADMPMEEMLKQIPGGAWIDEAERFVESLYWESNGEAMHESFGDGVTCAEAVLKLYERIQKARGG